MIEISSDAASSGGVAACCLLRSLAGKGMKRRAELPDMLDCWVSDV